MIIFIKGSFNPYLFYIFTDCKELITRNLVHGQFILLKRKRAMTLLVPFSGKYYRNGWKTRKAYIAEWNWRQGLKGDCQTVAPKVSRPTAELAEERKSRFCNT